MKTEKSESAQVCKTNIHAGSIKMAIRLKFLKLFCFPLEMPRSNFPLRINKP